MTQAVTLLTKDATLDNLSLSDYLDIIGELRKVDPKTNKPMSLEKFAELLGSPYSKALWGQSISEGKLNRQQRNELRRAIGMELLPMTIAEAISIASPDAAVWQVGDERPEHVIMVGGEKPVTISVDGSVRVLPECPVSALTGPPLKEGECDQTNLTGDETGATQRETRPRKRYYRACVELSLQPAIEAAGGIATVVKAGLKVLAAKESPS